MQPGAKANSSFANPDVNDRDVNDRDETDLDAAMLNGDQPSPESSTPRPGFAGFLWTAIALLIGGLVVFPLDTTLAEPDVFASIPGDLKKCIGLSEAFAHGFGIVVVGIGIWLLASDKRRFIPRMISCAIWPSLGVHLIKLFFARARPMVYFGESWRSDFPANIFETFIGFMPEGKLNTTIQLQSFPSAHTATVWGLAIGMTYLFPKGKWLYYAIALLASIQRTTAFAHWSSDVFFGAAIAFLMAGALTQDWGLGWQLKRFENWCRDRKSV
jgi:membrane-associated phospholipid phosphatase